jgi:hypothetical protein
MRGTPSARELAARLGLAAAAASGAAIARPAVIPTRRITCRADRDRARARCRDDRAHSASLDRYTEPSLFAAE